MDEIDRFLAEDLNQEGDVTSNALFTSEQGQARIISKEQTILEILNSIKENGYVTLYNNEEQTILIEYKNLNQ